MYLKSQWAQYVLVIHTWWTALVWYMFTVRSIWQASTAVVCTVFALPVFLQVLRKFISFDETWFPNSSSVAFVSSEGKQHEDTQWWEMSSASHTPPHTGLTGMCIKATEWFHGSMYLNRIYTSLSKWHVRHICFCIYHCTCTWWSCLKVLWQVTQTALQVMQDKMRCTFHRLTLNMNK